MTSHQPRPPKAILLAICILFFGLLLSIGATGCRSIQGETASNALLDWKYSDLRVLDPLDATDPDQDLIAVYSRMTSSSFEIRLDFLDLDKYLGKDLYILIDSNPGGSNQISTARMENISTNIQWDYLLEITDSGSVMMVDSHYSILERMQIFIVYDSLQDRIIIDVLSPLLPIYPGKTGLQVLVTPPGDSQVSDASRVFLVDEVPPPLAQVILYFWNPFTAITPAQTLRSWAGAHTGPLSSRHGLSYLLKEADHTKTPISLFGLSTSENISALDYISKLPYIENIINRNIVKLYESDDCIDFSKVILNKGCISDFDGNDYAKYKLSSDQCNLLTTNEITYNYTGGLTIYCKELFISHALKYDSSPLLLGGDFTTSIFGGSAESVEIFSYIASHPWIQVVPGDMFFKQFSTIRNSPVILQKSEITNELEYYTKSVENLPDDQGINLLQSLDQSPRNNLSEIAWQLYSTLTESGTKELNDLQKNYVGQIGELLAGSLWAETPGNMQTCNIDLDYDGKDECILANNYFFIIIEPDGGYIPFIFYKDTRDIHQIIGPTWQFVVGLSDPMVWDASLGVQGDPAQILGAMQDPFSDWNIYQVAISEDTISLTNTDGSIRKSAIINDEGIQIKINLANHTPFDAIIPLVLDPWYRFTPNWGDLYYKSQLANDFYWGIVNDEKITIKSTDPIAVDTFIDSRDILNRPEDPNLDYPNGHYLPYPMAIVKVADAQNISIQLSVSP